MKMLPHSTYLDADFETDILDVCFCDATCGVLVSNVACEGVPPDACLKLSSTFQCQRNNQRPQFWFHCPRFKS